MAKKHDNALKAAGKLAMAAELLLKSNVQFLSKRADLLQAALDEYNNEVMNLTVKPKKK